MAPLPTRRLGRPLGSQNKAARAVQVASDTVKQPVSGKKPRRELPDDPTELDKVLRGYKFLARPIPMFLSTVCEWAEMEPLSAEEKERGLEAIAAVLYQENIVFDARVMLAIWLAGVGGPRVAAKTAQRRAAKDKARGLVSPTGQPLRKVESVSSSS